MWTSFLGRFVTSFRRQEELQLVQTEYWDEKKNSKRKDGVLAELQAQTLNLNTELRAMRRESATAAPAAAAPVTPQPLADDPSLFLLPSLPHTEGAAGCRGRQPRR